ncbi:MAG: 5'-deoxynucleotidase [Clostridia bacterium]|nr:5'-deoxynucleotidase [Clostridia bacterium]
MKSHFYAMLSRMKNIYRWGLMRNTRNENLSEHSLEVAVIAHALAVIKNRRLGGSVDANAIAAAALFHDTSEIITGDMPTPVKYYNADIKSAYKDIEGVAREKLISLLPEDLRDDYKKLYSPDTQSEIIIKAADKISALIKCIEETVSGNREFEEAKKSTLKAIKEMRLPEAEIFLDEFIDSFYLPIDDMKQRD